MVRLELSEAQAEFLKDVLDWWLEDFSPATEDVIKDRSFNDPSEMLAAVTVMNRSFTDTVAIRTALEEALR